jgi:hypothetical protein
MLALLRQTIIAIENLQVRGFMTREALDLRRGVASCPNCKERAHPGSAKSLSFASAHRAVHQTTGSAFQSSELGCVA